MALQLNYFRAQRCVSSPFLVPRAPARLPCCHLVKASSAQAEPTIAVTFIAGDDQQPIELQCPSGEQLRAFMLDSKVDLYTTWGKIWQCGGAGQCGTCIVNVQQDDGLLSERTFTEQKKLGGKPATWRLACQTIVGNGSNTGKVVIKTKPQ